MHTALCAMPGVASEAQRREWRKREREREDEGERRENSRKGQTGKGEKTSVCSG